MRTSISLQPLSFVSVSAKTTLGTTWWAAYLVFLALVDAFKCPDNNTQAPTAFTMCVHIKHLNWHCARRAHDWMLRRILRKPRAPITSYLWRHSSWHQSMGWCVRVLIVRELRGGGYFVLGMGLMSCREHPAAQEVKRGESRFKICLPRHCSEVWMACSCECGFVYEYIYDSYEYIYINIYVGKKGWLKFIYVLQFTAPI